LMVMWSLNIYGSATEIAWDCFSWNQVWHVFSMIYWSLSVSLFYLGLHARTVLLGIMSSLPSTFCQMMLLPFVGNASEIYFLECSCDASYSWLLHGLLRWNMLCHSLVAIVTNVEW
jgi:hypothetical protein